MLIAAALILIAAEPQGASVPHETSGRNSFSDWVAGGSGTLGVGTIVNFFVSASAKSVVLCSSTGAVAPADVSPPVCSARVPLPSQALPVGDWAYAGSTNIGARYFVSTFYSAARAIVARCFVVIDNSQILSAPRCTAGNAIDPISLAHPPIPPR